MGGLRHKKLTREALQRLKRIYKLPYRSDNNVKQALYELKVLPKYKQCKTNGKLTIVHLVSVLEDFEKDI